MRARRLASASVVAAICGMMAVCLFPGAAMAKYFPDVLFDSDMKGAVAVTLDTEKAMKVTSVNAGDENNLENLYGESYCDNASVARLFMFTPSKTGRYYVCDAEDSCDTFAVVYRRNTGQAYLVDFNDDSSFSKHNGFGLNVWLEAGSTYCIAVSAYKPSQAWSAKLKIIESKKPSGFTVALIPGIEEISTPSYVATLTYSDGSKFTAGRKYFTDTFSDVYGNTIECTYGSGVSESDFENRVVGKYPIDMKLSSFDGVSFPKTVTAETKTAAALVASAKAVPSCGSALSEGYYVFGPVVSGYYSASNGYIYSYKYENSSFSSDESLATIEKGSMSGYWLEKGATYILDVYCGGDTGIALNYMSVNNAASKAAQSISVKKASASFKASKLKKKAAAFSIGAKASAGGKLTYKVVTGKKYVKVSPAGKVTVKKGAKKGTYKIQVSAAATGWYKAAAKTITVKVK